MMRFRETPLFICPGNRCLKCTKGGTEREEVGGCMVCVFFAFFVCKKGMRMRMGLVPLILGKFRLRRKEGRCK